MTKRKLYLGVFILLICLGIAYFSINDKSESAITQPENRAQLQAEKKRCACCKKLKDFRKRYEARRAQAKQQKAEAEK